MPRQNDPNRYDDLLDLPHPEPKTRPRMTRTDRAAQFSPFAALCGHGDAMAETARLTDQKIEPSEVQAAELNDAFVQIMAHIREKPRVQVTYFVPDARKEGGEYRMSEGCVRRIVGTERILELTDGTKIAFDNMLSIKTYI